MTPYKKHLTNVLFLLLILLMSLLPLPISVVSSSSISGETITVVPYPYVVINLAVSGNNLFAFAATSTNNTIGIFKSTAGSAFVRVQEINFSVYTHVPELGSNGLAVDAEGNIWFGTYTNEDPWCAEVYRLSGNGSVLNLMWNMTGPPGVVGNATKFDGVDYISVNNSPSLRIDSGMSFEAWIKFDNFANDLEQVFVEKGVYDANGINYLFGKSSTNVLEFAYSDGSWRRIYESSGWAPTDGVWYNIWIITNKTDNTVNFYANGTFLSSVVDGNGLNYPTNTEKVVIGIGNTVPFVSKLNGTLDEIRLYNRTVRQEDYVYNGVLLYPSEVLASWNSSYQHWYGHLPSNYTGLVAWWQLDEGTGTVISDSSGNGNTGTLTDVDASAWVTGYSRTDLSENPKYKHIHDVEISSTTNTIFVAFGDFGVYSNPELYRSQDNGSTWEPLPQLDVWSPGPARQVTALYEDNGTIYAGGELRSRIWKSTDDGDTWTTIKDHVDSIHYISSLYADGDNLACATNIIASFWMSDDGGEKWYRATGNDTIKADGSYYGLLGIAKVGNVYVIGSSGDNSTYATNFFDKSVNPEFGEGGLTKIGDFGYPVLEYGGYLYLIKRSCGQMTRILSSSITSLDLIQYGGNYVGLALGHQMTEDVSYVPQQNFNYTLVSSDDFEDGSIDPKWNHYGTAAEYRSESNGMFYLRQATRGYEIDTSTELSGDWALKITLTTDVRPDGENPALEDWRIPDIYFHWKNETFYHKITWMFNVTNTGNNSTEIQLSFNDDIYIGATYGHIYTPFVREILFTGSNYNVSTPNVWEIELRRYNNILSYLFNGTEIYRHYYNVFAGNWTGTPAWSDGFFGFGCYVSDLYVYEYELSTLSTYNSTNPSGYAAEITNMEGCGNWVFSEEKYYEFQAAYVKNGSGISLIDLDTVKLAFTCGYVTLYEKGWMNVSYNVADAEYAIDSGSDMINLKAGVATALGSLLQVTFLIYFKNTVLDAGNVDIYLWCNDTQGATDGWEIIAENYFNIYNLGGHTEYTFTGDAGKMPGGDFFDLYAYNNSYAEASIIFRNLQHVKMLPVLNVTIRDPWAANNAYMVEYILSYCNTADDWQNIFRLRIAYRNGTGGGSEQYQRFQISYWKWYPSIGGWGQILVEYLYVYSPATSVPNPSPIQLWIDIWINRMNSSSMVGGRVNAYYFPMSDASNMWLRWLTGSNWGKSERNKESMAFIEMLKLDADGNTVPLYAPEIKLMKLTCIVDKGIQTAADDVFVVHNYNVFDMTFGSDPLTGIQTPVFDETRVPIMPQGGFLGAVVSALNNFVKLLQLGFTLYVLAAFGNLVLFLDTIASWLGYPNAFSTFFRWLYSFWTWAVEGLAYAVSLLTLIFTTVLGPIMSNFLTVLTEVVTQWMGMYAVFTGLLSDTMNTGVNLWTDFNMSAWITIGAIFYPLYLLMLWEKKGIDAVLGQLLFIKDIVMTLLGLFINVGRFVIELIGRIIESIPIAE